MKKNYIIAIIIGAVLFATNIILACVFRGQDGANIFTAISGWVSFLATLFVGIIAYRQSRKQAFLLRKQNLINAIKMDQENLISSYSQLFIVGKHSELMLDYIMLNKDNYIQSAFTIIKNFELISNLESFLDSIIAYQYFPIGIKKLYDSCKEMIKFTYEISRLHSLKEDLDEDEYNNRILKYTDEMLEIYAKIKKAKTKVIVEMQYLILITMKANTVLKLQKIENRIEELNKNFKNEILGIHKKSKETDDGQAGNEK